MMGSSDPRRRRIRRRAADRTLHCWRKGLEGTWRTIAYVAVGAIALTGIKGQFERAHRRELVAQVKSLDALQRLDWRGDRRRLCSRRRASRR